MTAEDITLTERDIDILQKARVDLKNNPDLKENVPGLLDPTIHLSDEELDEFLKTFAQTPWGEVMKNSVKAGSPCEAHHDPEKPDEKCGKPSIGSVDFYASSFSDAILVCRDDVRFVYASIMREDMAQNTLTPVLTINGKEIPRIPVAEQAA